MSETRRRFLGTQILAGSAMLGVASPAAASAAAQATTPPVDGLDVSLDGEWEFRTDGETAWRTVTVPHTWQVMDGLVDYYGVAHYRRTFRAPAEAANAEVHIEFESVFHTAEVKLNGSAVGEHRGKGYTAFRTNELSSALKPDADNVLEGVARHPLNKKPPPAVPPPAPPRHPGVRGFRTELLGCFS